MSLILTARISQIRFTVNVCLPAGSQEVTGSLVLLLPAQLLKREVAVQPVRR